jgi:hypothetical protein
MEMGVEDGLSCVCARVKDCSISRKRAIIGNLSRYNKELSQSLRITCCKFGSILKMSFRNYQHMSWGLRIDVIECEN